MVVGTPGSEPGHTTEAGSLEQVRENVGHETRPDSEATGKVLEQEQEGVQQEQEGMQVDILLADTDKGGLDARLNRGEEERDEKRGHESPRGDASGEIGGGRAAAMGRDLGDMMAEVGRDVPVDGGGDSVSRVNASMMAHTEEILAQEHKNSPQADEVSPDAAKSTVWQQAPMPAPQPSSTATAREQPSVAAKGQASPLPRDVEVKNMGQNKTVRQMPATPLREGRGGGVQAHGRGTPSPVSSLSVASRTSTPVKTPLKHTSLLKPATPKAAAAAAAAALETAKEEEEARPASVRAMEETVRDSLAQVERHSNGIRMATIGFVSATGPLEQAIMEWHLRHERQVDGLEDKIRSLEARLSEKMGAGDAEESESREGEREEDKDGVRQQLRKAEIVVDEMRHELGQSRDKLAFLQGLVDNKDKLIARLQHLVDTRASNPDSGEGDSVERGRTMSESSKPAASPGAQAAASTASGNPNEVVEMLTKQCRVLEAQLLERDAHIQSSKSTIAELEAAGFAPVLPCMHSS